MHQPCASQDPSHAAASPLSKCTMCAWPSVLSDSQWRISHVIRSTMNPRNLQGRGLERHFSCEKPCLARKPTRCTPLERVGFGFLSAILTAEAQEQTLSGTVRSPSVFWPIRLDSAEMPVTASYCCVIFLITVSVPKNMSKRTRHMAWASSKFI